MKRQYFSWPPCRSAALGFDPATPVPNLSFPRNPPIRSSSGVGQGGAERAMRAKGANPSARLHRRRSHDGGPFAFRPKAIRLSSICLGHIYSASHHRRDRGIADPGQRHRRRRSSAFFARRQPDRVCFRSRGGQDNLWVMNADGSNARILYSDPPCGSPIRPGRRTARALSRCAMSRRRAAAGIAAPGRWRWCRPVAASRASCWREHRPVLRADILPDGRYVYFHSAITAYRGLSIFQYRQKVKRIELATSRSRP